jgi:hypothetical protein
MVIASERSYPTKRVCPILKPSSVWTQTRFLIRIVALTGVRQQAHPIKNSPDRMGSRHRDDVFDLKLILSGVGLASNDAVGWVFTPVRFQSGM